MKTIKKSFLSLFLLAAIGSVFIPSGEIEPIIIFPDEMNWIDNPDPSYKISTALLSGDPKEQGLYATQVKISKGTKLFPHVHPDSRMVVVLSGKFLYSYGNTFDGTKMRELTPGTFFTEPANTPHYAWAKNSDVLLQVTGFGPSGTNYIDRK